MIASLRPLLTAAAGAAAVLGALTLGGCNTVAFCFDCESTTGTLTGTGGSGGSGGCDDILGCSTSSGTGGCTPTNDGKEICDDKDNDCDGQVDEPSDIDFGDPHNCGNCKTNCLTLLTNNEPATIKCADKGPNPGTEAGTCQGTCAQDFYDLDGNGSCEYYCLKTAADDTLCNATDDDCDGKKDEDVDLCTSLKSCGKCANACVVLHGEPACVHEGGGANCDSNDTHCAIGKCDCTPGNCWWDLDKSYATGCEYQCELTNGGVEICGDGLDNDCDGKIDDGDDDLSGDPKIGKVCPGVGVPGDVDGECGKPEHAGVTACVAGKVACVGPNVIVENQLPELCDGLDNDCDGQVDEATMDSGVPCGISNIYPCTFGTMQCVNAKLSCVGAIDPGVEACNGEDDDCDGQIDATAGAPPSDATGACNVPIAPPAGVASACQAGTKQCVGGVVQCVGSKGPTGASDTCGVDANCDGALTNQPDLQTDVNNCGACGNDCLAGAVHANWACVAGKCAFQGCQQGYWDLDNDKKCEYACAFVSPTEACNGLDDNCNGQKDEGVVAPTPTQICGVSVAASSPECTSQVTVTCTNGGWKCTFPAGVCNDPGGCKSTPEICDALDNDCDGQLNENVPNYGQPCASDDGKPAPGDGACRTTGTFVCNGAGQTKCSAVKASCANLPGGCAELCDGIDNDCDGSVDEPFSKKGNDPAWFVKPVATKVAANRWIMSYEASRPSATSLAPGSGDGYWCNQVDPNDPACNDNAVPLAPQGVTIDRTPACSVANKIPWFNVTPIEASQTCKAMGGFVCDAADWQTTCQAGASCKWGYAPRGAACTSSYVAGTKFCNLGPSYDFIPGMNPGQTGDQDGLLPTASGSLKQCFADWSALFNNTASTDKVYDITGNLREIVKSGNNFELLGGAFDTGSESGAECGFTFYTVTSTYQFYDTGFRCCFSSDPTL